jgi:glycosyltransferase involved in cell wall biosynthesis
MRILMSRYDFADTIEDADVVILHIEPWNYAQIYHDNPFLKNKYVISYCVWEGSHLPYAYRQSLALVQEVWTCSQYCYDIIIESHPNTFLIPHVIERDPSVENDQISMAKQLLGIDDDCYIFLSIVRNIGYRKNSQALISCFEAISPSIPRARLILKSIPGERLFHSRDTHITQLQAYLTDSQINSLYKLANVYVSPHHSEGWGMTLSDAMLFGLPVIATGYSGNLQFMDRENSFLLDSKEDYITESELWGLFTPDMKWGYPDLDQLSDLMIAMYKGSLAEEAQKKAGIAMARCDAFSLRTVAQILYARINCILAA